MTAWGALFQAIAQTERYVQTAELSGVHSEDVPVAMAVSTLVRDVEPVSPALREEAKVALVAFGRKVSELHAAADAFDQRKAAELWVHVAAEFQSLTRYYGNDVLEPARALAEKHTCPMHPELTGRSTDRCSKCGMELDQPVRISLHSCGGTPVRKTITATIRAAAPPAAGRAVDAVLELNSFGRPLQITDLRIVHTYATQPGFYRLFVQVQIGNESVFASFGLQVAPVQPA